MSGTKWTIGALKDRCSVVERELEETKLYFAAEAGDDVPGWSKPDSVGMRILEADPEGTWVERKRMGCDWYSNWAWSGQEDERDEGEEKYVLDAMRAAEEAHRRLSEEVDEDDA